MYQSGYYRVLKDGNSDYQKEKGLVIGGLAYVVAGVKNIHVQIGQNTWIYEYGDEFDQMFLYEPNGLAERQAEIMSLMNEIAVGDTEEARVQAQLVDFNPHAAGEALVTGTELAPAIGGMKAAKLAVATVRNSIAKTKKEIERKTARMQALITEQQKAMQARAAEMGTLLKRAEEAIWSINLYLGKSEEIHVLRTGEPQPATEKIVLRQLVKFMDEECAAWPKSGGIDANSVKFFDDWLLADPEHLNQVLPERKGVVALHIRRTTKEYDNPWTNSAMNSANVVWTYFLAKNGDNVYRVLVDIPVGTHLFPKEDEFNGLFEGMEPGSDLYMKAIESANESNRHYLRVVLVLQGLLDRTNIFQPMVMERLNLCDPASVDEYVRFLRDDEKIITDGRPTFKQWQAEINDRLEIGHRIVGDFGYDLRASDRHYRDSRISPENACLPPENKIYTIESRENHYFLFRYVRSGDEVYDARRREWRIPKHRASCRILTTDDFFIDFDAATVEELTYYTKHRASRKDYAEMMPVLEAALVAKLRETEEEAPFIQLLVGMTMAAHQAAREDVEARMPDLVSWWKLKNRAHRDLTSNDTLAIEQIVAEYIHQIEQETKRTKLDHQAVLAVIQDQSPSPILVAHKADNLYVCYTPSNSQNIWVTEQIWSVVRGKVSLKECKPWRVVDNRHLRWEILYLGEAWEGWKINPVRNGCLTDAEIAHLVQEGNNRIGKVEEYEEGSITKRSPHRYIPLYVEVLEEFKIKLWYSPEGPKIPPLLVSGGRIEQPQVRRIILLWERSRDGVSLTKYLPSPDHMAGLSSNRGSILEENNTIDNSDNWLFQVWIDNIKQIEAEFAETKLADKTQRMLENMYNYAHIAFQTKLYKAKVDEARLNFMLEHGDPELWDDHLKSLKIQHDSMLLLHKSLSWFAERHLDPVGLTIGQVFEQCRAWGLFDSFERWDGFQVEKAKKIPDYYDLNWVIPPKPNITETNEDGDE